MPRKTPLRRRDFVKAAGGAGLLAGAAGCIGGDDDGGGDDEDPTPTPTPPPGEDLVEVNGFEVPADNVVSAGDVSEDQEIGTIQIIANPPDSTPDDYEACQFVADTVSELGVDAEVDDMTWPAQVEAVWYGRDWDVTFWEMVGRPSRLDPDEFLMQMFSSEYFFGYNYVFWEDEEYDETVQAQRVEPDVDTRQQLVHECQELIHTRGPSTVLMYPDETIAWNAARWDGVVELQGMGARNPLSFLEMEPIADRSVMVISWDAEIENINPFYQSGEVDMVQNRMLWDRLILPDETAMPQPWLADTLEWVADDTLEVDIKQGHTFHDGEEVLAEDVKFSFDVHKDFETLFSASLGPVNEVTVDDDYRVTFHLEHPFGPFELTGLGRIAIVRKNYWENIIENEMEADNPQFYQEEVPLGSGPLEFDFWERGNEARLNRFDDHFAPVAYDARVTRIIPSVSTILSQLETGEIDMLGNYRGDKDVLAGIVDDNDDLEMAATTTVGFKQLSYNNERPPFHIPEFRRAMSHRVNKDVIVDDIYGGWGAQAPNSPTSSALEFWHNGDMDGYAFDLQAAANELVEGGFVWDEDGNLYMPADNTEAPYYGEDPRQ